MIVALLTDFGTADGFVGAMKGVLLSINPSLTVVDISHEVEPFNILEGALLLKAHYRYFPTGTVFVAVVDPGVGSERKPILVETERYFFIGPDNGIFDLVLEEAGKVRTFLLENRRFQLERVNNTFHGRDIFAPAAGYLSLGVPPHEFGREIPYQPKLDFPKAVTEGDRVKGQIVYFDRFGNAVTNIPCGDYREGAFRGKSVKVVPFFQAGERGSLNLVCGSFGFMELFVPMENAKEKFGLKPGEEVVVKL